MPNEYSWEEHFNKRCDKMLDTKIEEYVGRTNNLGAGRDRHSAELNEKYKTKLLSQLEAEIESVSNTILDIIKETTRKYEVASSEEDSFLLMQHGKNRLTKVAHQLRRLTFSPEDFPNLPKEYVDAISHGKEKIEQAIAV